MKVAFVCVKNAGRSQMAHAFAEREVRRRDGPREGERRSRECEEGRRSREREEGRRGLDDVELVTGGTDPADGLHENVIAVMREVGIDLSDRTPRAVTADELADADVVVTMGCSAEGVCPATWRGDARDWDLDDPHGTPVEATREIRDDVERRVDALLDELADGHAAAND